MYIFIACKEIRKQDGVQSLRQYHGTKRWYFIVAREHAGLLEAEEQMPIRLRGCVRRPVQKPENLASISAPTLTRRIKLKKKSPCLHCIVYIMRDGKVCFIWAARVIT